MVTKDKRLMRLVSALDRLTSGNALNVKVKQGQKVSINMLAKEAGVGSGTLYYEKYADFLENAKEALNQYNSNPTSPTSPPTSAHSNLSERLADSERLKKDYRTERDEAKQQLRLLRSEVGTYSRTIYTLSDEVKALETLFEEATGMSPEQYIATKNRRNLTKV